MTKLTKCRNIVVVLLCCYVSLLSCPAHSIVWPIIDASKIASVATTITQGISKATSFVASINTAVEKINSIGDQISSMHQMITDLQGSILKLKESVDGLTKAVSDLQENIKETVETTNETINKYKEKEEERAKNTVETVEQKETYEEQNAIVEQALKDAENDLEQLNELIDDTRDKIKESTKTSQEAIDEISNKVQESENITPEDKEKIQQQADNIKQSIEDFNKEVDDILNQMKENLNAQYQEKVLDAYKEYSQALADYNDGKITKDQLIQAGNVLISDISSANLAIDSSIITSLTNKVTEITNATEALRQDVLNLISNDKEYSDDDETSTDPSKPVSPTEEPDLDDEPNNDEDKSDIDDKVDRNLKKLTPRIPLNNQFIKNKPDEYIDSSNKMHEKKQKYAFFYQNNRENLNAEYLAIKSNSDEITFLTSKELICYDKTADDIKKLKTDPSWLRNCITLAKGGADVSENEKNAFKNKVPTDDLVERNGIFARIHEDYNTANKNSTSGAIQNSQSWRGDNSESSSDSQFKTLSEKVNSNGVQDLYKTLALIDMEAPQLWNQISRVDAVNKAKTSVQLFRGEKELFLNNYGNKNPDVVEAISNNYGSIDGRNIFPNIFLHYCGIKAEDISLSKEDKTVATKVGEKEKNIKDCILGYAIGANMGIEPGSNSSDMKPSQETKDKWQAIQKKVAINSSFDNIVIALINNYDTTQVYVNNPEDGGVNIATLQKDLEAVTDSRAGYTAGAKITYYTTQQVLNIADAEATNLQAEILKDIAQFDYTYFSND